MADIIQGLGKCDSSGELLKGIGPSLARESLSARGFGWERGLPLLALKMDGLRDHTARNAGDL